MPKGFLLKCNDCGYLDDCENDLLECLKNNICKHCGSSNMEVIQQQEGQIGCTSRYNRHATNVNSSVDHPDPVLPPY
ncbi:hypothetical protein [Sporomusa sp. KB1]|jgi:hypothetical protein|uniref:hypothetical protein n=1 Tax=Sporomusa sp. KB1 TaxID=943346 RepID=UPI0011A5C42E|nr:hypothetical protein [Sporomusa sp. KB1]TWH45177.1 hypothetical protein Salpa_1081 [Sporomusa sp. KB1]